MRYPPFYWPGRDWKNEERLYRNLDRKTPEKRQKTPNNTSASFQHITCNFSTFSVFYFGISISSICHSQYLPATLDSSHFISHFISHFDLLLSHPTLFRFLGIVLCRSFVSVWLGYFLAIGTLIFFPSLLKFITSTIYIPTCPFSIRNQTASDSTTAILAKHIAARSH